ncbi:MAG: FGGY family carbohydrate kinase [Chitinophagaceae bacterium]
MDPLNVILIFDVGRTNKKLILFDEQYRLVLEKSLQLPETIDDDGYPCEDINLLSKWIQRSFVEISSNPEYEIRAVSFSGYGASMVHLDEYFKPVTPLYSYLKPYPENLKKQFYDEYGGELLVSKQTSSPVLGNLNSGLQLYRLKYEKPEIYNRIKYTLHLPQYISFLITATVCADITSIGCHTKLWDFSRQDYHEWVYKEGLDGKLAPIYNGDDVIRITIGGRQIPVGVGLHDSSAALIPYLANFHEPFILLSTGTWCISLNPFNQSPLTAEELQKDCLCYLTYEGRPVKASRLFAGHEHEVQTKRLAEHFQTVNDHYTTIAFNRDIISKIRLQQPRVAAEIKESILEKSLFGERDLSTFDSYEEAYHQLIFDLITQQEAATGLVLNNGQVKRIFVDGGFSKNPIFMHLLAAAFPDIEVFAASVAQATAMGAALAIHKHWNTKSLPGDIIDLKYYSAIQDVEV